VLEQAIRSHLKTKKILLMTHLVLGYPSFDENQKMIQAMADADVELVELQIPFSDPMADGPTILKASCQSVDQGTKVEECLKFAQEMCELYPSISFLFMTYYNIVYKYGETSMIQRAAQAGIKGFIIPDLPLEESSSWLSACHEKNLESIFIFTPTNKPERLKELAGASQGFIYCVGRRGVTGLKTHFDNEITLQIERYRNHTSLPIALGFGVRERADIEFLTGKADIAVIGSELIRAHQEGGIQALSKLLKHLRP